MRSMLKHAFSSLAWNFKQDAEAYTVVFIGVGITFAALCVAVVCGID
jgi:hypothetical protein